MVATKKLTHEQQARLLESIDKYTIHKPFQLLLFTLLSTTLITACTTVSDFRKMAPQERADTVCKRQAIFRNMADRRNALNSQIADARSALSTGYRVHKQCRQVKLYGNASTSCSTIGKYTNCQEQRPESYDTQCTETPVSINPELERSNITKWTQEVEYLNNQAREKWQQCIQSVVRISPEEAFKHY